MPKKLPLIVREIQRNPPQEIDYSYQKNISYSQISMFRQCPRRWKLQYKDKIDQREASIYLIFGIAIHETIQYYLSVFYNESRVKADKIDLLEDFQHRFISEYKTQYQKNDNTHFSSPEELREFNSDIACPTFIGKPFFFLSNRKFNSGLDITLIFFNT